MEVNNPVRLPEEYLKTIGSATAVMSLYEFVLEKLIWKLLELDLEKHYGEAITTHMGFRQKIHVIGTLCEHRHSISSISLDNYAIAKEIMGEADEISRERNKIIHGLWSIEPDLGKTYLMHLSAYGKFKFQDKYENIEELNNFINDVNKKGEKLLNFVNSL